jgi:hypothetical protein
MAALKLCDLCDESRGFLFIVIFPANAGEFPCSRKYFPCYFPQGIVREMAALILRNSLLFSHQFRSTASATTQSSETRN